MMQSEHCVPVFTMMQSEYCLPALTMMQAEQCLPSFYHDAGRTQSNNGDTRSMDLVLPNSLAPSHDTPSFQFLCKTIRHSREYYTHTRTPLHAHTHTHTRTHTLTVSLFLSLYFLYTPVTLSLPSLLPLLHTLYASCQTLANCLFFV